MEGILIFLWGNIKKSSLIWKGININLLNYFRWGNGIGTSEDRMPYMSMYDSSVYSGTVVHELWHILGYNFAPTVKQEDFYWYVESSANWFTIFYDKSYITGNAGVFYAKPYLSLWHTHVDKVSNII